jgi:hypothetical protein
MSLRAGLDAAEKRGTAYPGRDQPHTLTTQPTVLWGCRYLRRDNHVLIFYTVIYCHYAEHTDELQLER